jgi:hypothetical protein
MFSPKRSIDDLEIVFDNTISAYSGKKIRITQDKQISVFDVIGIYSGVQKPRNTWAELSKKHPEVAQNKGSYKFPGRGQKDTPVMDLKGIIKLVMVLPGRKAACSREQFAELIIRYLGGDMTLIDEVVNNNKVQELLPSNSPLKIETDQNIVPVEELVNKTTAIEIANSSTGIVQVNKYITEDNNLSYIDHQLSIGKKGVYITTIGIHKNKYIFKYGNTGSDPMKRIADHCTKFTKANDDNFDIGICPFYFRETIHYDDAERAVTRLLKNLNLHLGEYKIGNITNRELFTVSVEYDIKHVMSLIDDIVNGLEDNHINDLALTITNNHEFRMKELEYTHLMEIEKTKQFEAECRVKYETEKFKQEQEKTRQLELQLEILKVQKS